MYVGDCKQEKPYVEDIDLIGNNVILQWGDSASQDGLSNALEILTYWKDGRCKSNCMPLLEFLLIKYFY